jgi:hypothetical protein
LAIGILLIARAADSTPVKTAIPAFVRISLAAAAAKTVSGRPPVNMATASGFLIESAAAHNA